MPNAAILIVDDDALVRMHGADVLERAGFNVREACCAAEALKLLEIDAAIDLLFSDIDMPGQMDGIQLSRHVGERWPHVRVLLTSGNHAADESVQRVKRRFVGKPWTEQGLLEVISRVLAH